MIEKFENIVRQFNANAGVKVWTDMYVIPELRTSTSTATRSS